ncbi:hypothetical protein [Actinomadura rupiterrae]|uniref:hypothetical protein n=1 Tax=Actinomadura rupiterrae TaxID=559627 RepID=UPI0020A5FAE0|nr:hypothetical protein [Actinomadura rupiterrae]MCP2336258.1 hypothetical protein [Actinomadura rupiterrae]
MPSVTKTAVLAAAALPAAALLFLVPATASAASAAAPPQPAQVAVTDILCNAGGGFVFPDAASPTGFICSGGVFSGDPVIIT